MSRFSTPLCVLVVGLIGLLVYWPGLGGGFVFDDYPNLVLDLDWRVSAGTWQEWARAMLHGISSASGRPLAMLSFATNHYFTGLDPWPMKLTGLIWHLANGGLVFLLVRRLLDRASPASMRQQIFVAFSVALAWTVHPLQVSSALYIIQRMEVAAATFVLFAVIAYMQARSRQLEGQRGWTWFALALTSTGIGLGFKESAILAPGFALLVEACLYRFRHPSPAYQRLLVTVWATSIVCAACIFFLHVLPGALSPEAYAFRGFNLEQRLWTQMPVLTLYLKQILLPLPQLLPFYYDDFPISTGLLSPPHTAAAAIGLLALAVAAVACLRRWPLTSLGIGWFFMAHALTSNVIPLELAFEHRNYLALLGILIAIIPPARALARGMTPEARVVITSLPLAALAGLCMLQAHAWGDPLRLALSHKAHAPDSSRAAYALGGEFYTRAGGDFGSPDWSFARGEYAYAAGLSGSTILPDHALIIMDGRAGTPVPDASWASLRRKLDSGRKAGPEDVQALYGLVNCRLTAECALNDQELANVLTTALNANPTSAVIHTIYGNFAFNVMHDPDLAIRMAREALRLESDTVNQINLTRFLLASKLHGKPVGIGEEVQLMAAIRQDNRDGRWDEALSELEALAGSVRPSADRAGPYESPIDQ